jgi:hypothetical protein
MIYPDVEPETWAKRHDLDLKDSECLGCKKIFPMNVPCAIKGYRGMRIEEHGCPEKYRRTQLVPVDKEEIEFWNTVI